MLTRLSSLLLLLPWAASLPTSAANEGYVFVHFTNDQQAIYLSASQDNNALSFQRLNHNQPILTSSKGTGGLRDPHIVSSPDRSKFWILATDLDDRQGYDTRFGSRYIEIWESTDMINWGEQRHTLVSPPTAGMTWAPEAQWDSDIGAFQVFWASTVYSESDTNHTGSTYLRILKATTTDFVNFSEATVWVDYGGNAVDPTVYLDGRTNTWHRFTKIDAGTPYSSCTDIIQEKNQDLPSTSNWEKVTDCIGQNGGLNGNSMEGPSVIRTNDGDVNGDTFILFADNIRSNGLRDYSPLVTKDIDSPQWTQPDSWTIPEGTRHGTVMPVSAWILQGVRDHYGVS